MTKTLLWYWHIHHDVLVEPVIGSIQDRMQVIVSNKPTRERDIRLRLMRPVQHPERLPIGFVKAWQTYHKAKNAYVEAGNTYLEAGKSYVETGKSYVEAGNTYDKARNTYLEARKAYVEAGNTFASELEPLHAEECPDCPWNGTQIVFPRP